MGSFVHLAEAVSRRCAQPITRQYKIKTRPSIYWTIIFFGTISIIIIIIIIIIYWSFLLLFLFCPFSGLVFCICTVLMLYFCFCSVFAIETRVVKTACWWITVALNWTGLLLLLLFLLLLFKVIIFSLSYHNILNPWEWESPTAATKSLFYWE